MLKIGDFSKLSRISIRMLRYYDENDVLKPAYIDDISGYRFYDKEQIYWAAQIRFLKNAGFGVPMIKGILANVHNTDEIKQYFYLRITELQEESKKIEETIVRLKNAAGLLDKEKLIMQYKVEMKEISGFYALCTRGIIPTYEREDLLWKRMMNETHERGVRLTYADVPSRSYYYDEGFKEKEVDVEVCIGIKGKYEDSGSLTYRELPAETCACVTFRGGFEQITDACVAISVWVNEQGYTLGNYNFCIYHVGPGSDVDPKDYVIEVCFPIIK